LSLLFNKHPHNFNKQPLVLYKITTPLQEFENNENDRLALERERNNHLGNPIHMEEEMDDDCSFRTALETIGYNNSFKGVGGF